MQMQSKRQIVPAGLTLFIVFVFVQSLFFKFTNSPETQYIFGTLDAWGGSLGAPGLFARDGIFSQYVVGTGELIASLLLLAGLWQRFRILRPIGAGMALGVITGCNLLSSVNAAWRVGSEYRRLARRRAVVRNGVRRVDLGCDPPCDQRPPPPLASSPPGFAAARHRLKLQQKDRDSPCSSKPSPPP
jgi:uncharacterized membrane protein YphA (DoxX/SURF4 family)